MRTGHAAATVLAAAVLVGCGEPAAPQNSADVRTSAAQSMTSAPPPEGERSAPAEGEMPAPSIRKIPPAPIGGRAGHRAFWTGTEMIVWGGRGIDPPGVEASVPRNDGAAYDPESNSWRMLAQTQLKPREGAAAVWTGAALLVWGGGVHSAGKPALYDDGAAYIPTSNSWIPLPRAPIAGRFGASAVWTGSEMLVFGGNPGNSTEKQEHDGAAYDPAAGTWRAMPAAPFGEFYEHTSIWTGTELIVFAGLFDQSASALTGAAYNPATDSWRALSPAPVAKGTVEAPVWDGERVLLVSRMSQRIDGGKVNPFPTPLEPSGACRPASDSWEQIRFAPNSRGGGPLLWTGKAAVFWSGDPLGGLLYRAKENRWDTLPAYDGPDREFPSVVWTGSEVLVWGGHNILRYADGSHGDGPLRPLADGVALRLSDG